MNEQENFSKFMVDQLGGDFDSFIEFSKKVIFSVLVPKEAQKKSTHSTRLYEEADDATTEQVSSAYGLFDVTNFSEVLGTYDYKQLINVSVTSQALVHTGLWQNSTIEDMSHSYFSIALKYLNESISLTEENTAEREKLCERRDYVRQIYNRFRNSGDISEVDLYNIIDIATIAATSHFVNATLADPVSTNEFMEHELKMLIGEE